MNEGRRRILAQIAEAAAHNAEVANEAEKMALRIFEHAAAKYEEAKKLRQEAIAARDRADAELKAAIR